LFFDKFLNKMYQDNKEEFERISKAKSIFEALFIPTDSEDEFLKKNYKKMLAKTHPDKNDNNIESTEAFKKLQNLYNEYYSPKKLVDVSKMNFKEIFQIFLENIIPFYISIVISCTTYTLLVIYLHNNFFYLSRFFYSIGCIRILYLMKNWQKEEKLNHAIHTVWY